MLTLDTANFTRNLQRYVQGTGADAQKSATLATRIYMRHAIALTPPGDGAQSGDRAALTKEDERRGRASIISDLAVLFSPVRLKKKREEQWPDVAGIHHKAFVIGKTPGKRLRSFGAIKYVDQAKVKALTKELFAKIGRLAAYWLRGVDLAGAKGVPAWVRRHGARGDASLYRSEDRYRFMAANTQIPSAILGEQERRMGYAEHYTGKSLDRMLQAVLTKREAEFSRAA